MKSIRLIAFITLLSSTAPCIAQKEAAIWYFGDGAGLNFNSGSPIALTNGKLNTDEGCTTISDKNGNLLFYTDGSVVYNKRHQLMPNGTGLLGHLSSTQSAIIIPKPNNPNIYYIFTVDEPNPVNADIISSNDDDPPNSGLNYSVVDMRLNNGLGDIVSGEKNIPLITYDPANSDDVKYKCSEKITAVQHSDGSSFWVITHFKNSFYSFKISNNGVDQTPIKTITAQTIPLGGYKSNAIGYLKASPNGKKVAMANMATKNTDDITIKNTGNVWLYDFDTSTGLLSNQLTILKDTNPYGVEFSPKTTKLYVTFNRYNLTNGISLGSSLVQFDLKKADIINSQQLIYASNYVAGALQLAIDEKIYRAGYSIAGDDNNRLSVINNPEADGTNCNYMQDKIDLKTGFSKLGLPPFITSLFLYTFDYEFNCFGDSTHFFINSVETIDSILWDFGDGSTSTDHDAHHTFAAAGDYKITLTKTVNGDHRDPIVKMITIYGNPIVLSTPYKLIQCDTQDSDPLDGIATFNLTQANDPITLGNNDYEVFYYHDTQAAQNDIHNSNSINPIYRNNTPNEILFAKVTQPNSSCYTLTTVILQANPNLSLSAANLHHCDSGNGTAAFDLEQKKQDIKNALSLAPDVRLFLYNTETDAALSQNEIKNTITTVSKTIFLRAENNEGCYGTGQFELIVDPLPNLSAAADQLICTTQPNTTLTLETGIQVNQLQDYTYLWSTGATTPTITIDEEGIYSVTVSNSSNCSATINIPVKLSHLAVINSIEITDFTTQNEVIVHVNDPEFYQYKIQFEDATFTDYQNSPIFQNIPGGFHELIIENKDGCGHITKSFSILNIPKFFTPNNDGQNDYWNFNTLNNPLYENATIFIYDRYGKLLKQLSPLSIGWDGTYNKAPLPASDYWFTIQLADGREAKGHFSLKR